MFVYHLSPCMDLDWCFHGFAWSWAKMYGQTAYFHKYPRSFLVEEVVVPIKNVWEAVFVLASIKYSVDEITVVVPTQ